MAIVASDVLGWWDFQEGSGSSIADASGNAHPATLGATQTAWTTGGPTNLPNGVSYQGSGSTNKVIVSHTYAISSGCFAIWVKASSVQDGLFGEGGGGGEFTIFFETGNVKSRTRYGGSDRTITSSTVPSTGTLYFLVYNFTSGAMEFFLNGSSVGTNAGTGAINVTGSNLVCGGSNDAGTGGLYTGNQYQSILFNRVLTSAEITGLYNAGAGKKYTQQFPTGPANVKTYDGITQSTGIKTYGGIALASIKSVNGLT